MKMHILIRECVPRGSAVVAASRALLAAHVKLKESNQTRRMDVPTLGMSESRRTYRQNQAVMRSGRLVRSRVSFERERM